MTLTEKDVWYLPTYQFRDNNNEIAGEGSDWAEAKENAKADGYRLCDLHKTVSAALVKADGNDYYFMTGATEREAKANLKKACSEFDFKLIKSWYDKE